MAIDFGSDYSTFRDDGTYGLTFVRITGPRVPLEGVARLWLTDPGSLEWAPALGFNIARLQNAGHKMSVLPNYKSFLIKAARSVDFVIRADVEVTYVGTTLTVNGAITLADRTTHPLLVSAAEAARAVVQFPSAPLSAVT